MPFLKKTSSSTARHQSVQPHRFQVLRRDEDSFILRGAEILRQQLKKQDESDLSYCSKLDAYMENPVEITDSFSSDDLMDFPVCPESNTSKRKGDEGHQMTATTKSKTRTTASRLVLTPSRIYNTQSSDIFSFQESTDDDTLFTDSGRALSPLPPPPPHASCSEFDSSFSFMDDTEWADMQRKSKKDVEPCSPAWSMPAKNVSDDEFVDDDNDEYTDAGHINVEEDETQRNTRVALTTLNYAAPAATTHAYPALMLRPRPAQASPQKIRTRHGAHQQKTPAREIYNIPSPLGLEYAKLLHDPAFRHALNAGQCWQSLVGQMLRFPSNWWNGARCPPLGVPSDKPEPPRWQFYGRFRVWNHRDLKQLVPNRASPGALLLHLIVQDLMTLRPVQDIVVGVFHPNARGVRRSLEPNLQEEASRDVWLAVRKREDCVSVIDNVMSLGQTDDAKTPLGSHRVTNYNMRAVFGDNPPMDTMFLAEDILYGRLARALKTSPELSPAEALLQEFVFED